MDDIEYSNSNQFKLVDEIRKKLGIGSDVEIDEPRRILQRTLKIISNDIFSKDVHFILELIQNAEDNVYSPGKEPSLIFKVIETDDFKNLGEGGALLVINNETGFQEADVRAICDIGVEHKSKKDGYIGEKGIGFKSVFRITDNPFIFSAGYQFFFTKAPDQKLNFGYIVPYWTDNVPGAIKDFLAQTCIVLPFCQGKKQEVERELRQIAPETILFLSKLKALQISIEDESGTLVSRVDKHYPRIELHTGEMVRTYWLSEVEIPVPERDFAEEKREGIFTRKISAAFPIDNHPIPEITVYAFLPTTHYVDSGLDFLINADFLLTANREQIQETRPWNEWLRNHIHEVFMAGFKSMLNEPDLCFKSYSFIPIKKSNPNKFFEPVVSKIIGELKSKDIIIAEDGTRIRPDQSRLATPEIRSLFGIQPVPTQLLKTKLVASQLEEDPSIRERLKSLGVKDLSEREIISCLKDEEWIKNKEPIWFSELYKYLQTQEWATQDKLANLRIILAEDGNIYCTEDLNGIYLPTKKAESILAGNKNLLENIGVKFIHSNFYQALHHDAKLENWANEKLNFYELDISMFCRELADQLRDKTDITNLKSASAFICLHFDKINLEQKLYVKANLPLICNNNQVIAAQNWSSDNPLVFPEKFDPQKGWQIVFPDAEDREHMFILSNQYLEGVAQENHKMWGNFFSGLGATKTPHPQLTYDLDWQAPKWLKTSENNAKKPNEKRAKALIHWLDAQIDGLLDDSCEWLRTNSRSNRRRRRYASQDSEFYTCIRQTGWIPTNKGFCRPADVFLDRTEIKELLGDSVPYLKIRIKPELIEWLRIKSSANFDDLLDYLKNQPSRINDKIDPKRIVKIYNSLSKLWEDGREEEFINSPLILVTNDEYRWLKLAQVIWPDKHDVFGKMFGYLEPEYKGLRKFFVDRLGVKKDVDSKIYADRWKNLIESSEATSNIETALEKIFDVMLNIAKSSEKPDWWGKFRQTVQLCTQNDHFSPPSKVFIQDDNDFKKIFKDNDVEVEYAWHPSHSSIDHYIPLYTELGVKYLSEAVTVKILNIGNSQPRATEKLYITDDIKLAICAYLWHQLPNRYEILRKGDELAKFLVSKEYRVDYLDLEYSLMEEKVVFKNDLIFWDQDEKAFYISNISDPDDQLIQIRSIIARKLASSQNAKGLEDFILAVLGKLGPMIDKILKKRNWSLPDDERRWINTFLQNGQPVVIPGPTPTISSPTLPIITPIIVSKGVRRGPHSPVINEQQKFKTYIYVVDNLEGNSEPFDDPHSEVDNKGMSFVMEYERQSGRNPKDMNLEHKNYPGYDIASFDEHDQIFCFIEVKSTAGKWGTRGITLSKTQFDRALELGTKFWLYIVENTDNENTTLTRINDPARRVQNFVYDNGWKNLAEID